MAEIRPDALLTLALGAPSEHARVLALGAVFAPSVDSRLVIFDPDQLDSARPLERQVPRASSWQVSLIERAADGGWRTAAAMIVLDRPGVGLPASWELALLDDGRDSFSIEEQTVVVTDAAALRHLRRDRALREQVQQHVGRQAGCHFFDAGEAACDLAWFEVPSEGADYGGWWGLNAEGEPIWLLIDLENPA